MGYDIYIKCCSTPLKNECKTGNCSHIVEDETYISYNFTIFKNYWHVSEINQHRGKTIIKRINDVLNILESEGIKPQIKKGEDGWTATKNVFAFHLERIKNLAEKYIYHRFYIDCSGFDNNSDTDSIYSFFKNEDEYEFICDNSFFPNFQHPHKGNIVVDSFEKASEAYTLSTINNDEYKDYWLDFAKKFIK